MLTVTDLIRLLQKENPNLIVVVPKHSEYTTEISIKELMAQKSRPDGHVHDSFGDETLNTTKYLLIE